MALTGDLPSNFNISGVDWNNPDIFSCDVINALILAANERILAAWSGEIVPTPPVSPASAAVPEKIGNLLKKSGRYIWDAFLSTAQVEDGKAVKLTSPEVFATFPHLAFLPPPGSPPQRFKDYISEAKNLLQTLKYTAVSPVENGWFTHYPVTATAENTNFNTAWNIAANSVNSATGSPYIPGSTGLIPLGSSMDLSYSPATGKYKVTFQVCKGEYFFRNSGILPVLRQFYPVYYGDFDFDFSTAFNGGFLPSDGAILNPHRGRYITLPGTLPNIAPIGLQTLLQRQGSVLSQMNVGGINDLSPGLRFT